MGFGVENVSVDIDLDSIKYEVLGYVSAKCGIDDVFSKDELSDWARDNSFTHQDDLDEWAEENGYVKEEK